MLEKSSTGRCCLWLSYTILYEVGLRIASMYSKSVTNAKQTMRYSAGFELGAGLRIVRAKQLRYVEQPKLSYEYNVN